MSSFVPLHPLYSHKIPAYLMLGEHTPSSLGATQCRAELLRFPKRLRTTDFLPNTEYRVVKRGSTTLPPSHPTYLVYNSLGSERSELIR